MATQTTQTQNTEEQLTVNQHHPIQIPANPLKLDITTSKELSPQPLHDLFSVNDTLTFLQHDIRDQDIPATDLSMEGDLFTRVGQLEAWLQEDARVLEMRKQKVRELEEQIAVLEAKTEQLRAFRGHGVTVLCKCVLSLLS